MSVARQNAMWAGCGGPTVRVAPERIEATRALCLLREVEEGYRWRGYRLEVSDDGGQTWRPAADADKHRLFG